MALFFYFCTIATWENKKFYYATVSINSLLEFWPETKGD
ncbi:unnamed protein product [Acidithrix sp. C25]|nr:unnamed protein product [Acidithrix sp. C25]